MKKLSLFACFQHGYHTSKSALKTKFKSTPKKGWNGTVTVPQPLANASLAMSTGRQSQSESQEPPSRSWTFGFDLSRWIASSGLALREMDGFALTH